MQYDSMGHVVLSSSYRCYLSAISRIHEPLTFKEAAASPEWMTAMQDEITGLQHNNTWIIVDLPDAKQPIGYKWIYPAKYNAYGSLYCYKARLVAKGYTQRAGTYFKETFSSVVKMVRVCFIFNSCCSIMTIITNGCE